MSRHRGKEWILWAIPDDLSGQNELYIRGPKIKTGNLRGWYYAVSDAKTDLGDYPEKLATIHSYSGLPEWAQT